MRGPYSAAVFVVAMGVFGASMADISGTGKKNDFQRSGLLSFLLSDGPVDSAEAVVMTFSGVELLGQGGSVVHSLAIDPPRQLDVLQLQGRVSETLLSAVEIDAGEFQQVRLLVETPPSDCQNLVAPFSSYIQIAGTQYPLVLPGSSGLTFRGQVKVEAKQHSQYLIDLDLRQSITGRGNNACYNLRPALRLANVDNAGHIRGNISRQLLESSHCDVAASGQGAAVYLYPDRNQRPDDIGAPRSGPLSTASVRDAGPDAPLSYELAYLPPGDYTLALTCQAASDDPQRNDPLVFEASASVSVQASSESVVDF